MNTEVNSSPWTNGETAFRQLVLVELMKLAPEICANNHAVRLIFCYVDCRFSCLLDKELAVALDQEIWDGPSMEIETVENYLCAQVQRSGVDWDHLQVNQVEVIEETIQEE